MVASCKWLAHVTENRSRKNAYLCLDELALNLKLARRLPADLAWRFHALPLAEDKGSVTVAMANPDDTAAREAIIASLGPTSCLVQGDPAAIDALLAEIWGHETSRLRVVVCDFPHPVAQEVWDYAQSLGGLLGARIGRAKAAGEMNTLAEEEGYTEQELLIIEEADHPLIHHWLSGEKRTATSVAVLTTRQPRWPLKSILLVILGGREDSAAVDWVLRLARQSASAVTVLAVVPPIPDMDNRRAHLDQGLPALLTTDTPLGRQMHQVVRHLVDQGIESTLRLRQGPPDWQIRREVAEGDCDLIAIAARPDPWLLHRSAGDLLDHLLRWSDRPVLIAKPTTAWK
jgi:nucleotide-binding universal stress UspA family protein